MARYKHEPDHPYANERGMVELNEEYYMRKAYTEPDMRMMNGNQPVNVYYISDNLPYVKHMANGKIYTSKKKFRDETKARGCVEVGNEAGTSMKPKKYIPPSRKERREHIKQAIYQLKNGIKVGV